LQATVYLQFKLTISQKIPTRTTYYFVAGAERLSLGGVDWLLLVVTG
jgi:hypothetical protein